jgi:hypothetical protein
MNNSKKHLAPIYRDSNLYKFNAKTLAKRLLITAAVMVPLVAVDYILRSINDSPTEPVTNQSKQTEVVEEQESTPLEVEETASIDDMTANLRQFKPSFTAVDSKGTVQMNLYQQHMADTVLNGTLYEKISVFYIDMIVENRGGMKIQTMKRNKDGTSNIAFFMDGNQDTQMDGKLDKQLIYNNLTNDQTVTRVRQISNRKWLDKNLKVPTKEGQRLYNQTVHSFQ